MKRVIVLGGYGNFGKRIVANLCTIEHLTIFVAGRNEKKIHQLINGLMSVTLAKLEPLTIDICSDSFAKQMNELHPDLVIHTGGPFQGQNYRVPKMCIEIGAHYIDLADDRRFVCDISTLNSQAQQKKLVVVSGASSVPGLSAAVIDEYKNAFSSITNIDIAIAPGNKAERGLATVKGILSYIGYPLSVFKNGAWQTIYGWMDSRVNDFGGVVGKRHLANVDVPDLELFPRKYNVTQRVTFQAGLELPFLHVVMVGMAYLAKKRIVKNWAPLASLMVRTSNLFLSFGSDCGAMEVKIQGSDKRHRSKEIKWTLHAPKGHGPYIPTLSTIILARKLLLESDVLIRAHYGAFPCVSVLKLEDFIPYFNELELEHLTQTEGS